MKFQFRLIYGLMLIVLLMLQFPAGSATIGTDNTNTSPATAETLSDGSSITADIDFLGDADYYNFSVAAATGARIWTTTTDSAHDTYLRLYNSIGVEISWNDDFNSSLQSNLQVFLQPGNYFVTMRAFADNSIYQGYTIYLRFISFADVSNEDNDDYTTSFDLTSYGPSANEIVGGDPDWFSFTSLSDTVEIIWDKPKVDGVYIDVTLYRNNSGTLQYVDSLGKIYDWDLHRSQYRYVTPGETYYLEIRIDGLQFSEYSIEVSEPTLSADSYENDDVYSNPWYLGNYETRDQNIYPQGDQDYSSFYITPPATFYINLNNTMDDEYSNVWLYVLAENLTTLYYWNIYSTFDQVLTLPLGVYYIVVNSTEYVEYTLTTILYEQDYSNSAEDNTREANAVPIQNRSLEANIHNATNVDYYYFRLERTTSIEFALDVYGSLNPYIYLDIYSPNGNGAYDWNVYESARDTFSFPAGTYYVVLSANTYGFNPQVMYNVSVSLDLFDDTEYNDDASAAIFMPLNSQREVIIYPELDQDWFRFELAWDANVTLFTTGPDDLFYDTVLFLYDSTTTYIFENDDWEDLYSRIEITLAAGTYYFSIESFANAGVFDNVFVHLEAVYLNGYDVYENDDTEDTASSISVNEYQNHTLHSASDVDHISLVLDGFWALTFDLDVFEGSIYFDIYLTLEGVLYFVDGFELYEYETYSFTADFPAGEYMIYVETFDATIGFVSYGLGVTGNPVTYERDGDNSFESASHIEPNTNSSSSIQHPGDVDFYVFTLETESPVEIYTGLPEGGDTILFLYNAVGDLIASNDDDPTSATLESLITITLAAGTYYIMVSEYSILGTIPTYNLYLDVEVVVTSTTDTSDTTSTTDTSDTTSTTDTTDTTATSDTTSTDPTDTDTTTTEPGNDTGEPTIDLDLPAFDFVIAFLTLGLAVPVIIRRRR